jgi:hypothetical protein
MSKYNADYLFEEYISGLQKYYPALRYSGRFSLFSGPEPTGGEFSLGYDENILAETEHLITTEKLEIIHYTSLKAGLSIIENGEIWLSQVAYCNDTKELLFAHLNNKNDAYQDLKDERKKYFITSFSDYQKLKEEDEFMMWRCYGNNGQGLALVFEVENPKEVAKTYLFGKVVYGERSKAFKNFNQFLKFDKIFRNKHPELIHNKYFNELLMISLLLKTSIWKKEKEIRLIGYHNYDEYSLKTKEYDLNNSILSQIYHTLDNSGSHRAYLKLPLRDTPMFEELKKKLQQISPESSINRFLPIFRLKKIILGHQISNKYFSDMENIFTRILKNYENKPMIEDSVISKYF